MSGLTVLQIGCQSAGVDSLLPHFRTSYLSVAADLPLLRFRTESPIAVVVKWQWKLRRQRGNSAAVFVKESRRYQKEGSIVAAVR